MQEQEQRAAPQQRALERRFVASRDVRWLVALAQLAAQTAEAHFPLSAPLEIALLRTQHLLQHHHSAAASASATTKAAVVAAYRQLLAASCADERGYRDALSRVALVLAACWVRADQTSSALELLAVAADGCTARAKWLLVARGMVATLTRPSDAPQALQAFCDAALLDASEQLSQAEGAFRFWFGVALFKRERWCDAAAQLQRALRCDFAPAASLNLAAAAHLRGDDGDVHAAARELQRALEIDFGATASLFNYAVLLGGMRNFEAQQQMLAYYEEAVALAETPAAAGERKRERSGTPRSSAGGRESPSPGAAVAASSLSLASGAHTMQLFAPNPTIVTAAMVARESAYAALENEDYEHAKQHFEQLLVLESTEDAGAQLAVHRDYIYVLLQNNLHELALAKCEQAIASMRSAANSVHDVWLLVLLYRADALLCLERVSECRRYLQESVEPQIAKALELRKSSASGDAVEVAACHTQLLNNLAVVTACADPERDGGAGVDAAIAMLRDGIQLYPQVLSFRFNLVLLLWRKEQKEAACAIWFEARKWSLHMDVGDAGDDQKAIEKVAAAEEAAISVAASPHPQISEHVRAGDDGEDGVSSQQLLYLDALVLNHWGKIQRSHAIQTSVRYVQYLDSLSRRQQQQQQQR